MNAFTPYNIPLVFTYKGKTYKGLNTNQMQLSSSTRENKDGIETTTLKYSFTDDIEIMVLFRNYKEYDTSEWTCYFENKGKINTGIFENIKCISTEFSGKDPVLQGIYGDGGIGDSGPYGQYRFEMKTKEHIYMWPETGRGTYNYFPYFDVGHGKESTLVALGWSVVWDADFTYVSTEEEGVLVNAGQKELHTYLKPSEKIRTPMVVVMSCQGRDQGVNMNKWRHWFIKYNMPKPGGKLFAPQLSGGTSWMYEEMAKATDDNQIAAMKKYIDEGVPITFWWMDAGWYFLRQEESLTVWLPTGTWMVDTKRFPSKFKAISDFGAQHGVKTLLWFEPEVVRLEEALRDKENGIPNEYMMDGMLANMGNPDFVDWMINRVSGILTEGGISLYRQDYGINPWYNFCLQNQKDPDRVGSAENFYVQGYYSYWRKLREKFPDMMLDSCAAGGGRNDIETMRYSVPLHKTDHNYDDQDDKQSMHQSLFMWIPYFGACLAGPPGSMDVDEYKMRSSFAPWIAYCAIQTSREYSWDVLRKYSIEWQSLSKYYYCDYYQLTDWSRGNEHWRGWEFVDSEAGEGFIQLFRPAGSEQESRNIILRGLDPNDTYEIKDLDSGKIWLLSGDVLMTGGIKITIDKPAKACVYTFKKGWEQ